MDSGQETSAIERAVLASERRRYKRTHWYHHRALWGACGLCLGLVGGVGVAKSMEPDNTSPYLGVNVPSSSAPQSMAQLKPEVPSFEKMPAEKLAEKQKPGARLLNTDLPIPVADYRAMPMPSEFREIGGKIAPQRFEPEIQVTPLKPEPKAPAVEDGKTRRAEELHNRIASLQTQRDELLKSFYEDAVPVKHLDEDIAKARAELKALGL